MEYHFICEDNESTRIDKYVNDKISDSSRSFIQNMIKEGLILVNGKPCKANYKCRINDIIYVIYEQPKELDVLPENIPLDIVYEDKSIIIISYFY